MMNKIQSPQGSTCSLWQGDSHCRCRSAVLPFLRDQNAHSEPGEPCRENEDGATLSVATDTRQPPLRICSHPKMVNIFNVYLIKITSLHDLSLGIFHSTVWVSHFKCFVHNNLLNFDLWKKCWCLFSCHKPGVLGLLVYLHKLSPFLRVIPPTSVSLPLD